MPLPLAGPGALLLRNRLRRMIVWLPALLFASEMPAMLFWMMLLRIRVPAVPVPMRTPKPKRFELVAP
ncbi:MAG: hypothetical protein LC800_12220 [Acidobacteria bacterium]|nr:hypothetical protein [Acidobacteriota bacterium]